MGQIGDDGTRWMDGTRRERTRLDWTRRGRTRRTGRDERPEQYVMGRNGVGRYGTRRGRQDGWDGMGWERQHMTGRDGRTGQDGMNRRD